MPTSNEMIPASEAALYAARESQELKWHRQRVEAAARASAEREALLDVERNKRANRLRAPHDDETIKAVDAIKGHIEYAAKWKNSAVNLQVDEYLAGLGDQWRTVYTLACAELMARDKLTYLGRAWLADDTAARIEAQRGRTK